MKLRIIFSSLIVLSVFVLLPYCRHSEQEIPERINFTYEIPEQVDDGWETAHMLDVGMDEDPIWKMMWDFFGSSSNNVHSILIIKDNNLVFEKYFGGYIYKWNPPWHKGEWIDFDRDTLHFMASTTKSFTSAMIGIAIDKGYIKSEDEKVRSFYPEYSHLFNTEKSKITLKHLLMMSSGLEWNEEDISINDSENDLHGINQSKDPIAYVLSKEVVREPGVFYYYSGGDTNVAGDIVRKASGMNVDQISGKFLFPQLGVTNFYWRYFPYNSNNVYCSGDLSLRPRDMAKFGQLYLDRGKWKGVQLISEEWVKKSTSKQIDQGENQYYADGYGYQWWLNTFYIENKEISSFSTRGWGGQTIHVFPGLKSVVVFTGGNYNSYPPDWTLLETYIIPALINFDEQ